MLPYTKKIIPERDECTIISELFSIPPETHKVSTSFFGLFKTSEKPVPLRPYEIAYTSCSDQEILENSSSRLMPQELTFMGNSRNFNSQPGFKGQLKGVPTLFTCVKNAFTGSYI